MIHRSALSLVALAAAALVGLAGCGSGSTPAPAPTRRPAAEPERRLATAAHGPGARPTATWSCGRCRPARSAWSSPTAPGS